MKPFTGTKAEHLAWAKARALEYLDSDTPSAADGINAATSMISDMAKHEEWLLRTREFGINGTKASIIGPDAVRAWIEGITP